jgi:hypothetical protein
MRMMLLQWMSGTLWMLLLVLQHIHHCQPGMETKCCRNPDRGIGEVGERQEALNACMKCAYSTRLPLKTGPGSETLFQITKIGKCASTLLEHDID